jgi:ribonuclease E
VHAHDDYSNEIDTDPALAYEPFVPPEPGESEVDTGPVEPEPQPQASRPEERDTAPAPEPRPEQPAPVAQQPEETAGPKKSGWWQRRTFF